MILAVPGSARRGQELYNGIPNYAALARREFVVAVIAALLSAHGGPAFFSGPILDILSDFCQRA